MTELSAWVLMSSVLWFALQGISLPSWKMALTPTSACICYQTRGGQEGENTRVKENIEPHV